MTWSFRDLNLSQVDVQKSGSLKPGRYVCTVKNPKLNDTRSGGKSLQVELHDMNGQGRVMDFINLYVPGGSENAKLAMRIGQERLKSLLVYGGHPNPDQPGDIKSLDGLVVGVNVEQGPDYEKDGVTRKGGGRPVERGAAYFDPAELGHVRGAAPRRELDDLIPF